MVAEYPYREDPFQRIVNVSWATGSIFKVTTKSTAALRARAPESNPCNAVETNSAAGNYVLYRLDADPFIHTETSYAGTLDDGIDQRYTGQTSAGVWAPVPVNYTTACNTSTQRTWEHITGIVALSKFWPIELIYFKDRGFDRFQLDIYFVNPSDASPPTTDPGWTLNELVTVG